MDEFGPQLAPQIAAACQTNAQEVAAALTRAFNTRLELSVGSCSTWDESSSATDFDGPGLIVSLQVGLHAALLILPENTGLVPAWCAQLDASGTSRLKTLGLELGVLVLPESHAPSEVAAARVPSITAALQRVAVSANATMLPLSLTSSNATGNLTLLWPVTRPEALAEPPHPSAPQEMNPTTASAQHRLPNRRGVDLNGYEDPVEALPNYSRNLLRIEVPVTVTLATKKQPIGKIVELVPGAILQFNKSCDEMLDLEVSGQPIAHGECVKVGDKFGLRVMSLILPAERFGPVKPHGSGNGST